MRLPPSAIFLLRSYLTVVAVCALFRLLLLAVAITTWQDLHLSASSVLYACFMGWRFDSAVAAYVLAVPFLVLGVAVFVAPARVWPRRIAHGWLVTFGVLLVFMLAADIPWFLHNYARLNVSALLWAEEGRYMLGMVAQERSFAIYLLPFIGGVALLLLGARWARAAYAHPVSVQPSVMIRAVTFLLIGGLLVLGMRGRIAAKSPLQIGTAYFSDDPFLNQLGLNPAYTFATSAGRKLFAPTTAVDLMAAEPALWNATRELGGEPGLARSPIARRITPHGPADKANVVIILLESMSAFKMGKYNGPRDLTPFISSLENLSLTCDNAFSAGIHTFNGIYSTLYSFPALYDQQPLQEWLGKRHQGLGNVLRGHGYSTLFATTHDPEFDNMKGFLLAHGFDRVISEEDYPSADVLSTNGVPDHRMFEHVLPVLDGLAEGGPFLSVFMTTSDHKPYIVPEVPWFTPRSDELEQRIVEYVDASVAHFFELAAKRDWYRNTIFVILGDHGINMGHTYDMPLSFHHTPLLFHVPSGHVPIGRINAPCGQIDVAPTILGMLNLPWTNTTMGLDIRTRQRPFMYFCADDRIGCIDSAFYYINRPGGHRTLYRHAQLSTDDLLSTDTERVAAMERYTFSMMRSTQWLVDHDLLDGGLDETLP